MQSSYLSKAWPYDLLQVYLYSQTVPIIYTIIIF
jgi:hypothetical protein